MSKRKYALATGRGIFFDERTALKVTPGQTVEIDKEDCGSRTAVAIQNGHLLEVNRGQGVKSDEEPESDSQAQQATKSSKARGK